MSPTEAARLEIIKMEQYAVCPYIDLYVLVTVI